MEKHSFNIQETVNMIRPDGDVEIPVVRVVLTLQSLEYI